MAGQVKPVVARQHLFKRGHIIAHRPIRRSDNGRRPGHDVIGGKDDAGPFQREGDVVCRVPRRMDRRKRPAIPGNRLAVAHRNIRHKTHVGAFGKGVRLALMQGAGGAMRPLGDDQRAGRFFQSPR